MKLNYKVVSELIGISKTTYYEWEKEKNERKILTLLKKYFSDKDLIQFNEEGKIDNLELYQEWKRNQIYIEIKLIQKLHTIILDENGDVNDYQFIDFIMKLFMQFEKIKKGESNTYDKIGLISYITNFTDVYNLYMLENDISILNNSNSENMHQHTILKKLKIISSIDDEESIVLQKNIANNFEDMLNTSIVHGDINSSRGIALMALIYFVYSRIKDDKIKKYAEYKINFAIQSIIKNIMSTQSNKKILKIYIDAKINLENSLNSQSSKI